ncbi:hypothetical protein [Piscirickettsia salmonis]|uniref:hypothetical protein n=1 Tax=Piscirickettsia salmonis TaxID=1238 RepID=UPI0007D7982F|nr:hypothetical protein A0O36_02717 [Piscirickettsiaceae bacterium NZ-RLO1]
MKIDDVFNVTAKDFCKILDISYRHFKRLKQEEVFDQCEGEQKHRWDLTKVIKRPPSSEVQHYSILSRHQIL